MIKYKYKKDSIESFFAVIKEGELIPEYAIHEGGGQSCNRGEMCILSHNCYNSN